MYRLSHRPSLVEASGLAGFLNQVLNIVRTSPSGIRYRVRRVWQEQIEIRSLEQLDDRLLRDIGIPRAEIPRVVKAVLDAAEAKRAANPAKAEATRISLADLGLRPCVNC